MNICIDRNSSNTITEQIQQQISDRISSGLLAKGSRLPSIRKLSETLKVSHLTIVRAYSELEMKGFIVSIQGKGTYVKQDVINGREINKEDEDGSVQWQLSIPDYLPRAQILNHLSKPNESEGFNLAYAAVNHALLPTGVMIKQIGGLLDREPEILSRYGPVQGDLSLRGAVAEYMGGRNLSIVPQEVIITNGAQQGLSIIANTFTGPGDIVAMEAPTYSGAIDVFRSRGAVISSIPVDRDGMRTDMLLSLCDKEAPRLIYVTPNYNNPTGYYMSSQRRKELLDIAKNYNCLIIEDDPWSEISFDNTEAALLKSSDKSGHVIYVKGYSKIIGPGYRIGAVCASGSILSRLIAAKANSDLGTSLLTQKAIVNFIRSKKMNDYIRELNYNLNNRRNMVLELLRKNASREVRWTVPKGGINIWITLPRLFNSDKLLADYSHRHKIYFVPSSICYPNEPEYNHLRINFSYLDQERLKYSVTKLCSLIDEFLADGLYTEQPPVI